MPTIFVATTFGEGNLSVDPNKSEMVAARVTQTHLVVTLADGRDISTPLEWYPSLRSASPAARRNLKVSRLGVHWPDLDEDLSVEGMLQGRRAADSSR